MPEILDLENFPKTVRISALSHFLGFLYDLADEPDEVSGMMVINTYAISRGCQRVCSL